MQSDMSHYYLIDGLWLSFVVEVDVGLNWRIIRLGWVNEGSDAVRVEGNVRVGNIGDVGVERGIGVGLELRVLGIGKALSMKKNFIDIELKLSSFLMLLVDELTIDGMINLIVIIVKSMLLI